MIKVQQKVSDCFRSVAGAEAFSRIHGYLSTLRKQEFLRLSALQVTLWSSHSSLTLADLSIDSCMGTPPVMKMLFSEELQIFFSFERVCVSTEVVLQKMDDTFNSLDDTKRNCNYSGTSLGPPAAAFEKRGKVWGHPMPRPWDCVPRHPFLNSYEKL